MYKYRCNECGETTTRTISGWRIQCSCGGWQESEPKEQQQGLYQFVCPKYGHTFNSDNYNEKQCPICGYWDLVIHYTDAGQEINRDWFNALINNINNENKYIMVCPDCKAKAEFYYNEHLTCFCGQFMEPAVNQMEVIEKLKDYRKKKKLNQQQMADKLKISRSLYAMIELNQREINQELLNKATKIMR